MVEIASVGRDGSGRADGHRPGDAASVALCNDRGMIRSAFPIGAVALLSACEASSPTRGAAPEPLPVVAPPTTASVAEGARLFRDKGCTVCHSLDGTPLVGPTMQGYFGSTVQTNKGARVVDAAFVTESILEPQAVVTNGFNPVMPPYAGQLKPPQLESIAMYLLSLSLPPTTATKP